MIKKNNKITSFYQRLSKSKDGKRLVKNFGYLSILEATTHLFPLITLPYLGRVIGVKGFGILAIGMSVIAYFRSLTTYGFEYSSVRDVAQNRDDVDKISKIISKTIFSKAFLMLMSIIALIVCCWFIPFFRENQVVIWCTFLLIPGTVINTDWIFQGLEDMRYITMRNLLAKFITTLLIFCLINNRDDYLWQPILQAIGIFLPSILGIIVLRKKYGIYFKVPPLKEIILYLRDGFNMFITVFLPTVYTNLNVLLLGSYQGVKATGYYNGGSRFTSLAFSLFKLISRTVYPFFSRRLDRHSLYVKFSLTLSVAISLFFFIFARPLVLLLLGPEFEETINVLRIVAFTPIAMSLMNSYGLNYLVLKKRENIMSRIILITTVFGILLGMSGAILFSYIGVAFASLITQFIRAGLVTYYARKVAHDETAD
mgnify:CR=1 FL=1